MGLGVLELGCVPRCCTAQLTQTASVSFHCASVCDPPKVESLLKDDGLFANGRKLYVFRNVNAVLVNF